MIIAIILLLLALGLQGVLFWLYGWYQSLINLWTWIVLPFAFFWGLFAIYVFLLFLIGAMFGNKEPKKPSKFAKFIVEQTAFICMIFMRVHVHANGMGTVPSKKTPFMLINNHLSIFDEFALIYVFRHHGVLFISKEANFKIPVAGNWLRKAGYLSIIQGDLVNGTEIINKAAEYIKSGENSICVAPEGTRNKTFPNPLLLPFHSGTFNLAKNANCPIVVAAIQNTYAVMKRWPLKATSVYIDIVGVIDAETVQQSSSSELAEQSASLILKRFEEKEARFYHLDEKKPAESEESAK